MAYVCYPPPQPTHPSPHSCFIPRPTNPNSSKRTGAHQVLMGSWRKPSCGEIALHSNYWAKKSWTSLITFSQTKFDSSWFFIHKNKQLRISQCFKWIKQISFVKLNSSPRFNFELVTFCSFSKRSQFKLKFAFEDSFVILSPVYRCFCACWSLTTLHEMWSTSQEIYPSVLSA